MSTLYDLPALSSPPFRHVAEDRTVRFTRRSLRTLSLLLFGVVMVLSMLMVLTIAQRQNSVSMEHDRLLMQQAWQNCQERWTPIYGIMPSGAKPGAISMSG